MNIAQKTVLITGANRGIGRALLLWRSKEGVRRNSRNASGFEIPKASPESLAPGILNGLENGEEDIFPDAASQSIAEVRRTGVAKEFERQDASFVPHSAVAL
jgi:NAD(P)-dependent dehydrogenase (short-subunit alcohol dehydrogenase family)